MLPRCKATHLGSVWVTWVQVRLDQGFLGPWGKESILQSDNKVSNCTRVHMDACDVRMFIMLLKQLC